MRHEEMVIDGVLHWRGLPDGEWVRCTPKQITERLEHTKQSLERASTLVRSVTEDRDQLVEQLRKLTGIASLLRRMKPLSESILASCKEEH